MPGCLRSFSIGRPFNSDRTRELSFPQYLSIAFSIEVFLSPIDLFRRLALLSLRRIDHDSCHRCAFGCPPTPIP